MWTLYRIVGTNDGFGNHHPQSCGLLESWAFAEVFVLGGSFILSCNILLKDDIHPSIAIPTTVELVL